MTIAALLNHHARRIVNDPKRPNVLLNCHTRGIHSTMLHDEPGNRVRLFFAGGAHMLWLNHPDVLGYDMTLSVHPHHCDLTLVRLFGNVYNITGDMLPADDGRFHECTYSSAILGGEGALKPTGRMFDFATRETELIDTGGTEMLARDLHTIYVPYGRTAAWLVMEGAVDPDYRSICYTANPEFSMAGMYLRGSRNDAVEMLRACVARMNTSPSSAPTPLTLSPTETVLQ